MRKPADIDAQIKALQDKARSLKERQKSQLGELVLATGADALPLMLWPVCCSPPSNRCGKHPKLSRGGPNAARPSFAVTESRDPAESVTGPVTLLRKLQATARLLKRAAIQRHRLDAQKTRTDMRDWAKARRERTRHLIELGGLVQKAGLVEVVDDDRATLLGAFMELADRLRGSDEPRRRSARSRHALAPPRPPGLRC